MRSDCGKISLTSSLRSADTTFLQQKKEKKANLSKISGKYDVTSSTRTKKALIMTSQWIKHVGAMRSIREIANLYQGFPWGKYVFIENFHTNILRYNCT